MRSASIPGVKFVPLRARLTAMLVLAVFVFGAINLLVVGRLSYRALTAEQTRRLTFVAGLMARRLEEPILHDDLVALHALLDESVGLDPDLAYIVVTDAAGGVLAHTFGAVAPGWIGSKELVEAHRPAEVLFANPDGTLYRDLAVPILGGRLGTVRVGLEEEGARAEVRPLLSMVAAMVTVFLVLGVVATVWVARRITSPLSSIVGALERFDLSGGALELEVSTNDELEVLAGHVRVITERLQRLYRAERARDRELARVERLASLGTLAAGLAHELNNPLAGIKHAAQRLAQDFSSPNRTARYAAALEDAARRMEKVLSGMLDFSRPAKVELGPVAVAACAESVIGLVGARVCRSCLTLELEDDLPGVIADRDLLVQTLLNLVLNAVDAVGVCCGRVECEEPKITIEATCAAGGRVRIAVSDRGPGVAPEDRERVFDPFFTTKPAGRGTGLGLPTSWALAREMGGSLVLDPDWAEGARFVVELEAADAGGEA